MKKNQKPIRNYHKADYESLRTWFMNIQWNRECGELSVDDMWQKFCIIINQAIDRFVPIEPGTSTKKPCWINRKARFSMKYKSRMWIRYRESKS
jgi:hypothetical protein